ncbi:MAG: protein kinase [Candidatus Symbiothrix sp.]|jgi:serine/threonine protein kinase|nr:protein kinase [Candidatus Symbiothrix sp.]
MEDNNASFRELAPGTALLNGTYTIERTIGAGGFGITYYAKHTGLNNYYVIKEFFLDGRCVRNTQAKTVITQGINEDTYQKYRQKFIEEAQTLAKLDHPNIVKVMNVFDENNTSYIVMPFVEGKTLQGLVEKHGQLDYNTAVNYIGQLSEAVGHIHKKDILHRDIKPDNIIVTPKNTVVLIDFGSAREFVHDKTQSHTTMLTQGYAPLEQYAANSRKGAYSDIYAIGATLYFAITGQKPLDATSRTMETMPEPRELNTAISEDANRTIMKAMQMKAENRHQNIQEFMDDLLGVRPSDPIVEDKAGSGSKSKMWIAIIIALLLGIAGLVLWITLHKKEPTVTTVVQNNQVTDKKMTVYGDEYVYTGQIKDGVPHGQGKAVFNPGDKDDRIHYEGAFINGYREGKGLLQYNDGMSYEGDFVKNELEGRGKLQFGDGRYYEGSFSHSQRNGYGNYTDAAKKQHRGEFKDDNLVREI